MAVISGISVAVMLSKVGIAKFKWEFVPKKEAAAAAPQPLWVLIEASEADRGIEIGTGPLLMRMP